MNLNVIPNNINKIQGKKALLTRIEHTTPAIKHMANHLTRVLKLSVEASRTLIGREGKKTVLQNQFQTNSLKNIFSLSP